MHEIATLEPKPGRRFASVETRYVVPDVLVKKVGDDYAIILNEDGMPRLRINSYYRSVIGQGDEARRYVEDRMRSAVWLIRRASSSGRRPSTRSRTRSSSSSARSSTRVSRTSGRCLFETWPRTSACTSRRSAA